MGAGTENEAETGRRDGPHGAQGLLEPQSGLNRFFTPSLALAELLDEDYTAPYTGLKGPRNRRESSEAIRGFVLSGSIQGSYPEIVRDKMRTGGFLEGAARASQGA